MNSVKVVDPSAGVVTSKITGQRNGCAQMKAAVDSVHGIFMISSPKRRLRSLRFINTATQPLSPK